MLHEVTYEGGMGFCHKALPSVLPYGYHGPLVVALDSTAQSPNLGAGGDAVRYRHAHDVLETRHGVAAYDRAACMKVPDA